MEQEQNKSACINYTQINQLIKRSIDAFIVSGTSINDLQKLNWMREKFEERFVKVNSKYSKSNRSISSKDLRDNW